jgi:hypothetical protein
MKAKTLKPINIKKLKSKFTDKSVHDISELLVPSDNEISTLLKPSSEQLYLLGNE